MRDVLSALFACVCVPTATVVPKLSAGTADKGVFFVNATLRWLPTQSALGTSGLGLRSLV